MLRITNMVLVHFEYYQGAHIILQILFAHKFNIFSTYRNHSVTNTYHIFDYIIWNCKIHIVDAIYSQKIFQ